MLLALPLGAAIGLALGMVGGGGAVLAVPAFVYLLGQDVHAATTASLVVVGAASLVAAARHGAEHHVCWRGAAVFALPAALGTLLGTVGNQAASGRLLILLFAPVLLAAAYATWRKSGDEDAEQRPARAGCPPLQPRRTLPAGLAVGLLTGFFGVGGGFVIVPTLVLWLHLAMREAIGTSLVIVSLVSAAALATHLGSGSSPDWALTLTFTAAAAAGAAAGAALTGRVPQRLLAQGFAALVAAVGVYLLVEVALLGGPPSA